MAAVGDNVMAVTPAETFINGTSDGLLATDNATTAIDIKILRVGTGAFYLLGNVVCVAIYNVPLTAAQVLARTTAIAAL